MVCFAPFIPCSLGQDHLLQRQIRHGSSEPGILSLQLFQPFGLMKVHAAILLAPTIVGMNRETDLSYSLLNRFALAEETIHLMEGLTRYP